MAMKWDKLRPIAVSQSNYYGVLKVVYFPGLVCSNWRHHTGKDMTTIHAFLMGTGRTLCPTCLGFELSKKVVTTAVDNKHWMPRHWKPEMQSTWKDTTLKKYWGIMKVLSLATQIEILTGNNGYIYNPDLLLQTRANDLPPSQKQKLFNYLCRWGVDKNGVWADEIDKAIVELTQWRNDAFRTLTMHWIIDEKIKNITPDGISDAYISPSEIKDIMTGFTYRVRSKPLTEKQRKLLRVCEADQFSARQAFTNQQHEYVVAR